MLAARGARGNRSGQVLAEGIEPRPSICQPATVYDRLEERAIGPDEISEARLPRTLFGGYERGPTDDLLRRVAWDYRQVARERHELATALAELKGRLRELEARAARPAPAGPPAEEWRAARPAAEPSPAGAGSAPARAAREAILERARAGNRRLERAVHPGAQQGFSQLAALEELRQRLRGELRSTLGARVALDEPPAAGPDRAPPLRRGPAAG
jgi:cell division septum initiation protein DivIVA